MVTPPLNSLRAFEAVARLGSFRAAADVLCVTESAVSHQIRNVEEALGKPLFEREGNRTRILPVGRELALRLSGAFAEVDAAVEQARNSNCVLVIAAIPSVAMCWLIPRLSRFRFANPEIEVRIVYAFHGHEINFHDVQIAFVYARSEPTGSMVEGHFFLGGQSVPVCSPARLHGFGKDPETISDFLSLGLLHDRDETGWKTWLAGLEVSLSALKEGAALEATTFEDFNLLRAAALSGQGVALCPPTMIQPDLNSGALVQISDRVLDEGFNYFLLTSTLASPRLLRHAQIFRDWALAERGNHL